MYKLELFWTNKDICHPVCHQPVRYREEQAAGPWVMMGEEQSKAPWMFGQVKRGRRRCEAHLAGLRALDEPLN